MRSVNYDGDTIRNALEAIKKFLRYRCEFLGGNRAREAYKRVRMKEEASSAEGR